MIDTNWKYISETKKQITKHYKQLMNAETNKEIGKRIEITHEELIMGK